ncbi:GtrA family protein [Thioalkalivibrio paradoxus]|uniref:GtrA family protein n=1 Tax=Thioalkalivibrio paradoxus TaxID=108010 RepID=UPI00046CB24B|nr:GtrA family protein [Thioalkalivibrio paradoxus]
MCTVSVGGSFACFVIVGGIATTAHYATLMALVEGLGIGPVPASGFGFLIGAIVGYVLNRRFTFASDRRHREALPRYLVVALGGLIINVGVLASVLALVHWHYLVAQVIATLAALFWNFGANRLWTFRSFERLPNLK